MGRDGIVVGVDEHRESQIIRESSKRDNIDEELDQKVRGISTTSPSPSPAGESSFGDDRCRG